MLVRSDRHIALLLACVGGISLVVASLASAHPFNMSPSMQGVLTCGVLGFVLAILHPLPYRQALRVMLPIVAVQLAAFAAHGINIAAAMGIEALVYGVVGLIVTRPLEASEDVEEPLHGSVQAAQPVAPVTRLQPSAPDTTTAGTEAA